MIDFNVPRSKDCITIDTKDWRPNNTSGLEIRRLSGKTVPTYVAQIINVNIQNQKLKGLMKNDLVLISRVASEVAEFRTFAIERDDKRFYNVPVMQVLGYFKYGIPDFKGLTMLFDKILIKKIDNPLNGSLMLKDDNTLIGEVVKVGTCRFDDSWNMQELQVKVGDKVIIRDNVSTEIILDGKPYYATEEAMVVGVLPEGAKSLDEIKLINKSIICEPYLPEKVLDSKLLITPVLDYEDEDLTDIYNRNLFKVLTSDANLTNIEKNDILLIDRNMTNYVYFNGTKYFITQGLEYVEGKVISR